MPKYIGDILGYFNNDDEPQLEYLYWLGMPRDQEVVLLRVTGATLDPAAIDFTVDLVGPRITDEWNGLNFGRFASVVHRGVPIKLQLWLMRVRREGVVAAYEEVYDVNKEIWRASMTMLECLPVSERGEAVLKIAPGIALLSKVNQQANLIEDKGYAGYTREQLVAYNSETIERMARKQRDKIEIKPFTKNDFRNSYPIQMSRSNIYHYVKDYEWQGLEGATLISAGNYAAKNSLIPGLPAGFSGFLRDLLSLARGETGGSSLAAFQSTKATGFDCGGKLFRFRGEFYW